MLPAAATNAHLTAQHGWQPRRAPATRGPLTPAAWAQLCTPGQAPAATRSAQQAGPGPESRPWSNPSNAPCVCDAAGQVGTDDSHHRRADQGQSDGGPCCPGGHPALWQPQRRQLLLLRCAAWMPDYLVWSSSALGQEHNGRWVLAPTVWHTTGRRRGCRCAGKHRLGCRSTFCVPGTPLPCSKPGQALPAAPAGHARQVHCTGRARPHVFPGGDPTDGSSARGPRAQARRHGHADGGSSRHAAAAGAPLRATLQAVTCPSHCFILVPVDVLVTALYFFDGFQGLA